MIFKLSDNSPEFPNPALAEEDGLLAVGGDLGLQRLLNAYQAGIFPWYSKPPILWFSPHERFVLFPDEIKISKSMQQVLNSGKFEITVNNAFEEVIDNCAKIKRAHESGTWINTDMQRAYINLYNAGYANSVEVRLNKKLVGGLYGVKTGKVFSGESMFSQVSNASKTALIYVAQNFDIDLIDCQVYTEHLESMGARFISRADYLAYLPKIQR